MKSVSNSMVWALAGERRLNKIMTVNVEDIRELAQVLEEAIDVETRSILDDEIPLWRDYLPVAYEISDLSE
jgi:hypothetical protein